jgi:hypothetical protein
VSDLMLFGHNTNVKVGETTFHIQTEDRGTTNALIDTTVYFNGRVLHRRTNNYFDLLPLDPGREQALKLRLDEQHRSTIEELRSGALHLALPHDEKPATAPNAASDGNAATSALHLELLNAKTWLSGKHALLQVAVRDSANKAVEGAKVTARVDGAAEPIELFTVTGPFGHAQLEFDMPRLTGVEVALVIEADHRHSKGHLRFQLKAKPRVPSAAS